MLSGAIGLQIIARRLGVELGEQQFNKFNNIDTRELTFKEIKKLTSDHSLVCRALKTNSSGLAAAVKKQPVLAQLKSGRYVIVLKFSDGADTKKTVTIIDPKASSPKAENIDIAEFNSVWNGAGLIFKKSRRLRQASGEISVGAIFDDILEDKWVCAQLVLIIIFINIFALAPIVFLMIVLDKVVNYESYATLYVVASGVLIAHVFNFLLTYYKSAIINLASAKIEAKYGMLIFNQIMNLPVSTFKEQSRQFPNLGQSLNNIRSVIITKFLGIITDLVAVLLFVPILIVYSPILGAIVVAVSLLNCIISALHERRNQSVVQDYSASSNDRQQVLTSVGEGFIDIKRLGLERDVIKEWKTVEGNFLRANDRNLASSAFISEFGTLLNNILTVVVLFVGVLMVFEGSLSAGVLIGVNMLIGKIFRPAQSLVEFPGEMKKLSQLLDSFASATTLTTENRTAGNFHDIIGSVSFQDVSFIRDQKTSVMENVSFSIDVHETVGICYSQDNTDTVSSVGHLLQGLFPTTSGSILLDGNDVSTFSIQHLRSNIALVDKTNHFFPGSLRDNFQRILPNANNDRILWACEIANAADQMQKLNVSPETQMEELQGVWNADLKIKLSLARALLRNPKLLILDDIFSDMDTDSILRFKATFDKISKSRTMILVSRDLHNLTVCKKLMFFNGTELAQYGPTGEILEQEGPAKDLMKKQLRVISPKFEQDYKTSIKSVLS
jgi:ATP-binding cassette subfamily B protein